MQASASSSSASPKRTSKWETGSSPDRTYQELRSGAKKALPSGEALKLRFWNVNRQLRIPKTSGIFAFCEFPKKDLDQLQNPISFEVGGMSNHGVRGGPLSFKGSEQVVGFDLLPGLQLLQSVVANYKNYTDQSGTKEMGVRSTDFHLIQTPTGKTFWLIVLHLSVGSKTITLESTKRYRILKSVMAQAHHLESKTGTPVVLLGDFNTTRAELQAFKVNEEGKMSGRGKVLIPTSTGHTTIGNFKTCFRFDGSDGVDLTTNINPDTDERFDIDHFFVPTSMVITRFEIDRSVISKSRDLDHAILRLDLLL